METSFTLGKSEIGQIKLFEEQMRLKKAQTINDFGRSELPRDITDQIADMIVGKSAEFIFRAFAYQFGITVGIDLNIYPDEYITDGGQDIPYVELTHRGWKGWYANNIKVDVKSTSNLSKWLLVEQRKFDSNAYVLVKMDVPAGWEKTGVQVDRLSGEVAGYAWYTDLLNPEENKPWFHFNAGDSLFHADKIYKEEFSYPTELENYLETFNVRFMNMRLRSKSTYGLPVHWLRDTQVDWEQLFNTITSGAV